MKNNTLLPAILHWADQAAEIRVVLLVGSRGGGEKFDALSDYDLSMFCRSYTFIQDDSWLNKIYPHCICIHEKFSWGEIVLPTRLVLFENGQKADFAFHPLFLLEEIIARRKWTSTYDYGYQLLLDKENLADHLPPVSREGYSVVLPGKELFEETIREFWFETYHVAKYLWRDDLWAAKVRDAAMKKWLMQMLMWNTALSAPGPLRIKNDGKNLKEWVPDPIYSSLKDCFSGWDRAAGVHALYATMDLFSELSRATALQMNYDLEDKVTAPIRDFIMGLLGRTLV